jgi:hypothetical protein
MVRSFLLKTLFLAFISTNERSGSIRDDLFNAADTDCPLTWMASLLVLDCQANTLLEDKISATDVAQEHTILAVGVSIGLGGVPFSLFKRDTMSRVRISPPMHCLSHEKHTT